MRFSKFYPIILLAIFCSRPCYGQIKSVGLPEIRNYKRIDYKGGTQNWNIDQDQNGNLYFANNNGLFQYDGSSWTKYSLPNDSSIRSLKIGNDGKIFVGGYNEFGYFKPNEKGKLRYFSISKLIKDERLRQIDFIWKIHIFNGEVIFQAFSSAFIFKNQKLTIVNAPHRFQFSFLVNNQLFFQDKSSGLCLYRDGKLSVMSQTTIFNTTEIWGMLPLSDNKILITTLDKGLFVYQNNSIVSWNTEANDFIKKNSSLGGVVIKNDFIVLNSVLNGIIICNKSGEILQYINRKKGLQNNTILTSYVDQKDNLWLGLDNGIAFVNESSAFSYLGFSYELSTVYASVFYKGNLYVATNQGVFYHSYGKNKNIDSFSIVEGTTGQAWNIQLINDQLICSHNRGAFQIKTNNSITLIDNKGYWGFKKIPNRPNYYLGSNYNGIGLFEITTSGITFKNQIDGFSKSINAFEVDDKSIWSLKDGLLYQLSLSDDFKKVARFKTFKNLPNSSSGITSIQSYNGHIYFQSNNHFYRYSYEQELFFEDKKLTTLFEEIPPIKFFFQDQYKNIWYVSNESLGVLIKDKNGNYKNRKEAFSNLTGSLVNNYYSINAIAPDNFFIGLTDGLAHCDLSLFDRFKSKPKAFIRSFSYSNDTLVFGNGPHKKEKIGIPYASNNVKFTFSSPLYENIDNIEYSYQLEGFDNDWSKWSTLHMKEYTNLREGDYTMNLRVKDNYGIHSEIENFEFTVSPPWYRNGFAYLFYLILLGLGIYFIRQRIRLKIRKNKYYETIEQRKIYLEKESKIRQEQFELEKEIERLKNDKLKIKILSKDKELVNNTLQVVKKNKILNGIITKLKDIDVNSFDENTKFQFNKLNKSIVKEVNADKSWKDLEKHIKNVHFDFLKRLKEKFPNVSPRELDLATYLLMNMSTKEIAEIMNISSGGVELARYRLRKKLGLSRDENLTGFLMGI
jgi:DNA-binding CsgD family transcriptional regulator